MSTEPARSWRRYYIVINLVLLVILGLIMLRTRWRELWRVLQRSALGWLGLAGVTLLSAYACEALSWRWLLYLQRVPAQLRMLLAGVLAGEYMGRITPGRMGQLVRAGYVGCAAPAPIGSALASVVGERLLQFIAVVVGGLTAVATLKAGAYSHALPGNAVTALSILSLFFLIILAVLALSRQLHSRVASALTHIGPLAGMAMSGARGIQQYHEALAGLRTGWSVLGLVPELLRLWLLCVYGYFLSRSLSMNVAPIPMAQAVASALLVWRVVPISAFGFGSGTATYIAVLGSFGVSGGLAFSYCLLDVLFVNVLLPLVGAAIWLTVPPLALQRARGATNA